MENVASHACAFFLDDRGMVLGIWSSAFRRFRSDSQSDYQRLEQYPAIVWRSTFHSRHFSLHRASYSLLDITCECRDRRRRERALLGDQRQLRSTHDGLLPSGGLAPRPSRHPIITLTRRSQYEARARVGGVLSCYLQCGHFRARMVFLERLCIGSALCAALRVV